MKFVNSFLKVFAGTGVPAPTDARRANALLCAPPKWGLRPHDPYGEGAPPLHPRGILQGRKSLLLQCRRSALHPGDFPVAGKVTKGAPGAAPLDLPVQGYRPFRARCASRRATFCHRKRPICHFELGGQTGLYFSPRFCRENFLLLIRGAVEEWLHVWMQLLGGFGVSVEGVLWGEDGAEV